jgi:hypothetical protein
MTSRTHTLQSSAQWNGGDASVVASMLGLVLLMVLALLLLLLLVVLRLLLLLLLLLVVVVLVGFRVLLT